MSETTHLICARCGADSAVNNALLPSGVLTWVEHHSGLGITLFFNCPSCKAVYELPVQGLMPLDRKRGA